MRGLVLLWLFSFSCACRWDWYVCCCQTNNHQAMRNLAPSVWRCVHLTMMTVKKSVTMMWHVRMIASAIWLTVCTIVPVKADVRRDALIVHHPFVRHSSVASQSQILIISSARDEVVNLTLSLVYQSIHPTKELLWTSLYELYCRLFVSRFWMS